MELLAALAGRRRRSTHPRDRASETPAGPGSTRRGRRSPTSTSCRGPPTTCCPWGAYGTPFSAAGSVTSMVTSRGCPYPLHASATRPSSTGRRYRAHSAERVVAEIRDLVSEHGVREVLFKDSEFTIDRARVERFCDLMIAGGSARDLDLQRPRRPRRRASAAEDGGGRVPRDPARRRVGGPGRARRARARASADGERSERRSAARAAGIETVANLMVGVARRDAGARSRRRGGSSREIRPDHLNVQVFVPYPGTELHRTLDGRSPVPAEEARRRRRALLRSFYLRPGRVAGRVLTVEPAGLAAERRRGGGDAGPRESLEGRGAPQGSIRAERRARRARARPGEAELGHPERARARSERIRLRGGPAEAGQGNASPATPPRREPRGGHAVDLDLDRRRPAGAGRDASIVSSTASAVVKAILASGPSSGTGRESSPGRASTSGA